MGADLLVVSTSRVFWKGRKRPESEAPASESEGMTVPSVLRLVLDGTLHIDWWEPFGLHSRVSVTPIGPQVWPFPYPACSRRHFQEERCP
jgi:hypothetical protein